MGLISRYKDYEAKEFARRAAKKSKLGPYKDLKKKSVVPKLKGRVTTKNINTALGNPYGVKVPAAKKIRKIRRKRKRRKVKTVIVYK